MMNNIGLKSLYIKKEYNDDFSSRYEKKTFGVISEPGYVFTPYIPATIPSNKFMY